MVMLHDNPLQLMWASGTRLKGKSDCTVNLCVVLHFNEKFSIHKSILSALFWMQFDFSVKILPEYLL